jgi:hypothetical protein
MAEAVCQVVDDFRFSEGQQVLLATLRRAEATEFLLVSGRDRR